MSYTIYAIQNRINKKLYIGKTENPEQRLKKHLSDLKANRHAIEDMQDDFNKFGDVFNLYVLEEAVSSQDAYKEYKYMKDYRSTEREYGYNYKDFVAKRINFCKPECFNCETEEETKKAIDYSKNKDISKIVKLLNKNNDAEIQEIILQLLTKSVQEQSR